MNTDLHQNKQRPRRYRARPGVAANPNLPETSDMDSKSDDGGDISPEVAQDMAEAAMAETAASNASAAPVGEDASPTAGDEAAAAPPANSAPNNPNQQQRPARPDQQAAAQQRREQENQRREQENQRRVAEQQRRDQERQRREEETRKRDQDRQRREAEDRAKLPVEDLCKKAWDIYLAEVSEEGVELFPDNDARELARRSFRLAEIFLQEELRARRPPPPPPREPREKNGASHDESNGANQSESPSNEAAADSGAQGVSSESTTAPM